MDVSATRFRLTRAEDEQGRSLLWVQKDARFQTNDDKKIWKNFPAFRLAPPAAGAQKLAVIEGIANYVLPTKYETWTVADLLNTPDATREFGSGAQTIRVLIERARLTDRNLQLEIEVASAQEGGFGGMDNPLFSSEHLSNGLHIEDAKGHRFDIGSYGSTGNDSKLNINISLSPADPEAVVVAPLKLTLNAPVNFVQTEVPFSFSDVPLP